MNGHKVFLASVLVLLFVGGSQKELLTSAHICGTTLTSNPYLYMVLNQEKFHNNIAYSPSPKRINPQRIFLGF